MPSDQFHRVEKLTGECEQWRYIGQKDNPIFEGLWVNEGTSPARFYKDKFNIVHLAGYIATGLTATTAFTLPEGYRPPYQHRFSTDHASAGGGHGGTNVRIVVNTDGTIVPVFSGGGGSTITVLDEVTWRV